MAFCLLVFANVRRDAMEQRDEMWTAAHIEIGGDDCVNSSGFFFA